MEESLTLDATVSAAVAHAVQQAPAGEMRTRLDALARGTARALDAARRLRFPAWEERQRVQGEAALTAPETAHVQAVLAHLASQGDALHHLVPASPAGLDEDFDRAFNLLGLGEAHPATGEVPAASPEQRVADLVQTYAAELSREVRERAARLPPGPWGTEVVAELEEVRDRAVGMLHAMLTAVLGVFADVELEVLFPQANEWVEMGVALRRHVAELGTSLEAQRGVLGSRPRPQTVQALVTQDDERLAQLLALPASRCLRAADRLALRAFHHQAVRLRATPGVDGAQALAWAEQLGARLSSLNAQELTERLAGHDQEVATEAAAALARASSLLPAQPAQAMLFVAHAGRRLARLYGVSPAVDAGVRQLRALHGHPVELRTLHALLDTLRAAVTPLSRPGSP